MQRYFASIVDKDVLLSDDDIFHLTKVMRARCNDEIEVVNNHQVFLCEIKSIKPLAIKVKRKINEKRELKCKIILIAALLKGEKMDFVVQKATELGANEIVFLESERTIIRVNRRDNSNRLDRYKRIAKEAAEQSCRLAVPDVSKVISINELSRIKADIKIIPYELNAGITKTFIDEINKAKEDQTIAVMVGPEGGFAEYEVNIAKCEGFVPVSLGRRILRAETASIYALSVISCLLEKK